MSIHARIRDAQEKNRMLISEIEHPMLPSYDSKLKESNDLFSAILDDILCYPQEDKEPFLQQFEDVKAKNRNVFQKLFNGDYTVQDAEIASNDLFVKFFNKLRSPGETIINLANYRTQISNI